MAQMTIPPVGEMIELTQEWRVQIPWSNYNFVDGLLGREESLRQRCNANGGEVELTFPKGTRFRLEEVFFRTSYDYKNGFGFTMHYHPNYKKWSKQARIWIHPGKIADLHFEVLAAGREKTVVKAEKKAREENNDDVVSFGDIQGMFR